MRRWDGTRIWYPNVKLNAMPLLNMSRSDSKVEIFKVCYSWSRPVCIYSYELRLFLEAHMQGYNQMTNLSVALLLETTNTVISQSKLQCAVGGCCQNNKKSQHHQQWQGATHSLSMPCLRAISGQP